jgi:hypothetical protein
MFFKKKSKKTLEEVPKKKEEAPNTLDNFAHFA